MAVHEVAAGLSFTTDLAELGVPVTATLGASFDSVFAPVQTLELTAALGFSAGFMAQRGDQNLKVVALVGGSLSQQEGRSTHVQPYRVTGLPASLDQLARLMEAREAPGVPLDGSVHPFDAAIKVIDRRASFQVAGDTRVDNTRVVVEVTWGHPLAGLLAKSGGVSGGGVFSIAPSSFTETIWHDKDDAIMRVSYRLPLGGTIVSRVVSADLQRQTWTATLTKEFTTPQYDDITRGSQLNSAVFGPFAARTLLFLGPTLNETDEGVFSHGYQFTYNPDGWKLRSSIWVTGFIPNDANELFDQGGVGGLGLFNIYKEFDFADLPVFFP